MNDTKNLRKLREASGLTLQEAAVKAGLTTQSVWNAMHGEVSEATAERIRKVLLKAVAVRRAEADELLSRNMPAETPAA
jgi:transcriptional regulator with XRE-family HTH domain